MKMFKAVWSASKINDKNEYRIESKWKFKFGPVISENKNSTK